MKKIYMKEKVNTINNICRKYKNIKLNITPVKEPTTSNIDP